MQIENKEICPTVFAKNAQYGDAQAASDAIEAIFCQMPAAKRLCENTKVLIKPNLLARHAPIKAVTTHPHVLNGVILALKARGVKNITVADSPGGPVTATLMRGVYSGSGLAEVCKRHGVNMYTEGKGVDVQTDGMIVKQFNILQPVREADFIINLPKLKTHVLTGFSGAVKNLFGCVPGLQKTEFHMRFPDKKLFADMLIDLCEVISADMHIVDGILSLEGDGPASGMPKKTNVILACENPYNLDLAICRVIGIDAMQTPVPAAAFARGLCANKLDETLLDGDEAAKTPFKSFATPKSYTFIAMLPGILKPFSKIFTKLTTPRPQVKKAKCIACHKCADICPQHVINFESGKADISYDNCIRCFCCHEICPVRAIDVHRNILFGR